MSKEVAVKDCPFKHLVDKQELEIVRIGDMLHVHCKVCGSLGPGAEADEGAVKEWDTRDIIIISEEGFKQLTGEEVEFNEEE